MNVEVAQVLSQVIAFLFTVWVLKRFAWKPLLGIMEERQKKIQGEFDSIEAQKKANEKLTQDYNDKLAHIDTRSRLKIQEAIQEGRRIAQEIQDEAHNQARAILNKAQAEAEREVGIAKMELKREMVDITIAAAEKIIGEKLDPEKHKQLISKFVEEAGWDK